MFGYLRPLEPELLVKEQQLYRAVYCGLCRTMRGKVSFLGSFALSYDFVFLALLRAQLTGETFTFCEKRCPAHPFRKRSCACGASEALESTALVHFALTHEKLRDDLRDGDTPFFKRLCFAACYPFIHGRVKTLCRKNAAFRTIYKSAFAACEKLCELERQNAADVDELALIWSRAVAPACCVGLSGKEARLMEASAAAAGQLIYLLDACDDLEDDAKRKSFNAFLSAYGSVDATLEHLDEINCTLALYAQQLDRAVNLITAPNAYGSICENITGRGIPDAVRRIILKHQPDTVSDERKNND